MSKDFDIDAAVRDLVLTDTLSKKAEIAGRIYFHAKKKGIFLSSIHSLYKACGEGRCPAFTVPAMNLRTLTYYLARAAFRVAQKNDAGAFIFELARSEMGYTNQPPIEYSGVILAAAIKENYKGPVFIQGDHFQLKRSIFQLDEQKEIYKIKQLIQEAIKAGFFNIDIDSSTLVDITVSDLKEQQKQNYMMCSVLTEYIRQFQPKGITISVGGEIGEIGGKNSTEEELRAFMEGYLENLPTGMEGISKISIQTGTAHGGVVLADGSIANVKVDFETLEKLSKIAREVYSLGGAVQHGASTLPASAFHKFVEAGAIEIHLATQFQNIMFESRVFPQELRERMYNWIRREYGKEKKENITEEQFIYKTRKKALGFFKKDIMNLDEGIKESISHEIEAKFDFLFKQLKLQNTKDLVKTYTKPVDIDIGISEKCAIQDGEGDD